VSEIRDDVTRLLRSAVDGSKTAVDALLDIVYDELRQLASRYLSHERPGHTLQTTALVHEAYLKLVRQDSVGFDDRAQFFAAAATAMRRILVDHARTRRRQKRGGGGTAVQLDEALAAFEERALDLLALDEALNELARLDPRKAQLVELRFFAGLTVGEAASLMKIAERTAERDWTTARAWLRASLEGQSPLSEPGERAP
jgi:RNA polymerase sigma factor (TIGR02999 family)